MRPFGQAGGIMGMQQPQSGGFGGQPQAAGGFGQPQQQQQQVQGQGQGMLQQQSTVQQLQPTGQSINANNSGFPGHVQAFTNTMGVFEEYLVKSMVCEGKNFGQPTQNFSSEMLRWDDYRGAKQINDGTPSLQSTFDANKEGMMQNGLPFMGHRELITKGADKINNLYKVFVCHPRIPSTAPLNYCSEMDRWDTMRAEKQINDGTPSLRQTFSDPQLLISTDTDAARAKATGSSSNAAAGPPTTPPNPSGINAAGQFVGYQTETVGTSNIRTFNTYKVISCKPIYEGRGQHNWSTDMQRWDDYRTVKQITDGLGPLQAMFDVPPTATAAANRMGGAAGGFGQQQPQQGGGFGGQQQPQQVGGFGQQPQQIGGFGGQQRPQQVGGFGQQPQQIGGFGGQQRPLGGEGGGFGQQPQQQQQGGGFGQQQPPITGGGFGGGFGRRM